jgi:hypothetical protein
VPAVGRAQNDLLVARVLQGAVEAGAQPGRLQVVEDLLRLVLESEHVNAGAGLDVRQQCALLADPLDQRVSMRTGLRVADRGEHPFLEDR